MADTFRALLVTKEGDRQSVAVTELTDADLMEGDVTVAVEHSTVNYKDDLDLAKLNSMTSRARLDDVPALAVEVLAGKTRGRVVIDL